MSVPSNVAVWLEDYVMINIIVVLLFALWGYVLIWVCLCIKLFSWIGGNPFYKRDSIEFSTEFRKLDFFIEHFMLKRLGSKPYIFFLYNGLGCQMSWEFLFRFWVIETYSRARDNYHVSTLFKSGHDMYCIRYYQIYFHIINNTTLLASICKYMQCIWINVR